MRLTHATKEAINYACKHFHYSKSVPVNPLGYNVYNDNDEWCGVILYSRGANKNVGIQYGLENGQFLELVRVALNGKQECTSKALSMSLKQIHHDVPLCRLIISYADIDQNHLGIIYQATNWIYEGKMNENMLSAFIINGKKTHKKSIHSRKINGHSLHQTISDVRKYLDKNATEFYTKGKHKYLMPLDKKMRKQIIHLSKPYPKNNNN